MASIMISGTIGIVPASVVIEVDHLKWQPLFTTDEVAQDALPNKFYTVSIHTEKGSFVWYPSEPDKPSWWKRLLGK